MTNKIIFSPANYLKEVKKGFKFRLYNGDLSNSMRTFLKKTGFDKSDMKAIDRTVENYQERIEEYNQKNTQAPIKQILNNYKQAENLVDNILVFNKVTELKKEYKKQKGVWLPSRSNNPRHSHMLYYGKIFNIEDGVDGNGLLPGLEFGCMCGLQIILEK